MNGKSPFYGSFLGVSDKRSFKLEMDAIDERFPVSAPSNDNTQFFGSPLGFVVKFAVEVKAPIRLPGGDIHNRHINRSTVKVVAFFGLRFASTNEFPLTLRSAKALREPYPVPTLFFNIKIHRCKHEN